MLSINCGEFETGPIDTSAKLAAIVTDEAGSGALTFGGLASTGIDTSSELATILTDEAGSGALTFGGAASGANSDITSLTGLTTALSIAQGGTAGTTAAAARSNLGAAATTDIDTSAELAAILTDETGSGSLVFGTSPTLVTPTLGIASATSIAFGNEALANYDEGTFTPTVTTVSGTGTVPQYSTNTGRYTRIGRVVYVDVYLTGDGGNEGSGATDQLQIALPVTASASHPTKQFPIGSATNDSATENWLLEGTIAPSATTVTLYKRTSLTTYVELFAGNQSNVEREIRLKFWYEL